MDEQNEQHMGVHESTQSVQLLLEVYKQNKEID